MSPGSSLISRIFEAAVLQKQRRNGTALRDRLGLLTLLPASHRHSSAAAQRLVLSARKGGVGIFQQASTLQLSPSCTYEKLYLYSLSASRQKTFTCCPTYIPVSLGGIRASVPACPPGLTPFPLRFRISRRCRGQKREVSPNHSTGGGPGEILRGRLGDRGAEGYS